MYLVATPDEIDDLVQKTLVEYKNKVIDKLAIYQPNQKIPKQDIIEVLNDVYEHDFELVYFKVEGED